MRYEKRNMDQLRAEMAALAQADPSNLASSFLGSAGIPRDMPSIDLENPGLTRAQLEDRRWKISAPVAEASFLRHGFSLEGRSARKIYVWPLILRIEGVSEDLSRRASPQSHPDFFDDLINTQEAAAIMRMSPPHLRKLVDAGQLFRCDIIRFGARGMYRFRRLHIEAEARRRLEIRLVGETSRCAQ